METVWTVGEGGLFDVYASQDVAEAAVMESLGDDFYSARLDGSERAILAKLMDSPRLAIQYYNSVAKDGYKLCISEHDVHTEVPDRT